MKTREFFARVDHDRVVRAISEAELKTSGELRVYVSRRPAVAPVSEAVRHFTRLGMEKTRDRNAVLIFVAPLSNTFAVVGDQAVHDKCGQQFWSKLALEMTDSFKAGDFTEGLLKGISKAGVLLAEHFPRREDDQNELPDSVEEE